MNYIEAMRMLLEEEMKRNKNICILGQDVELWGASGGLYRGLAAKFKGRVINTPISEAATVGIATGMAMMGKRPIVEFSYFDFILCATDQVINHTAKTSYITDNKLSSPVIFRAVLSSHLGYGVTHSQNLEYIFMPHINVVYPSTPEDAIKIMRAALRSDKPTLYIEHRVLQKKECKFADGMIPIGKSLVKKKGNKLLIISYGRTVPIILDIAKDKDIEVVDLLSLNPLDEDRIISSARRIGKVLIIEDGPGLVSGYIASKIINKADADVKTLHADSALIPAGKESEEKVLLSEKKIMDAISNAYKQ
ncbi:MAG: hypothetical protein N3G74_02330 [Candidatus Micrarchaeota archaeon]|nr:hypothetical protein [Candidatus Micrarchaeota archaeon]